MREFLTLDHSRFPIVIGKYHPFVPAQDEFIKAQLDIESFSASHDNFALILDFSEIPILSSEYRIASAKWATKNDALFVRQKMKVIFLTPSVMARVVMKSVFIISRPSIPYILTNNLEKSISWASKQLGIKNGSEKFPPLSFAAITLSFLAHHFQYA